MFSNINVPIFFIIRKYIYSKNIRAWNFLKSFLNKIWNINKCLYICSVLLY